MSMRRHFPRNTLNRKQRYVMAFDTETKTEQWGQGQQRLTWRLGAGWYCDRRMGDPTSVVTPHRLEFVRWMLSHVPSRGTLWCYAHNLWFDFKVVGLHKLLPRLGWELTWFYFGQGGGSAIIVFKKGKQKIAFMNSYNYFQMPLARMGEIVGLQKMEVSFEHSSLSDLSDYCLRDAEIVFKAVLLLMDRVEQVFGIRLEYTSGSTAIAAWRNTAGSRMVRFHDLPKITEWERLAVHGGRVEAWRLGRIPGLVTLFDVTSMYPSVMMDIPMPVKILRSYNVTPTDRRIQDPRRWSRSLSGFHLDGCCIRSDSTGQVVGAMARCVVRTDDPIYPILQNGRVIFPVGTFETTLSPVEFEYALARSQIISVSALALYEMASPFGPILTQWWKARHEALARADKGQATMIKLIGNSLYGKFAQRALKELWREDCDPDSVRSEPLSYQGQSGSVWELCGQRVFMLNTTEPTKQTHYPIAGQILAGARIKLWMLIEDAGRENVVYMDTDSLMVLEPGRAGLMPHVNDQLGGLKIEWEDRGVEIFGPKDYRTSTYRKTKGISAKAEYLHHLDSWRQTQFVGVRGDLARGNTDGIIIRNVQKHLKREYKKGVIQPDGRITPFNKEKHGA